nr:hypothetical transcript [Hymenolepis microstoma]
MQSTLEELTCGACSKLINDPYKLPCGHTFCLRPCILAHAEAVKARCVTCNLEFNASELRRNYLIAANLHLRLQDKSEKENNRSETPQVLDLVKSRNQTRCSVCQKLTDENELKYCQHCHRNVFLFPDEATKSLCCWDSRNADRQRLLPLNHNGPIRCFVHSPTTAAFLSCSDDNRARFWYKRQMTD